MAMLILRFRLAMVSSVVLPFSFSSRRMRTAAAPAPIARAYMGSMILFTCQLETVEIITTLMVHTSQSDVVTTWSIVSILLQILVVQYCYCRGLESDVRVVLPKLRPCRGQSRS